MLTFILGGVRSGKSKYAGEIADKISKNENKKIVYIATYVNEGKDAEMTERIEKHKNNRPNTWKVMETGKIYDVASKLGEIENSVIIIDCLTLLVSNFFAENKNTDESSITSEIEKMLKEIVEGIKLLARTEGIFTETAGGVTVAVTKKLIEQGRIKRDE
ncbi:MAG: bifunctional adenosylcobinamide kinase/adenosylcobinamide-phosphate guanylyltransferase, partial [Candidatus Altarchaeum sp.]|nr:bifunctional adenosylcobinamide kinase/adenosylcobinamide-phosphate guanylyltransferase [Candidatus Altarchaeum sp.]